MGTRGTSFFSAYLKASKTGSAGILEAFPVGLPDYYERLYRWIIIL
jgi:hypothetical protein